MSELVSKCVLRVEVNDQVVQTEERNDRDSNCVETSKQLPKGNHRIREISVETFPSRLESPKDDWGLLPLSSRENASSQEKPLEEKSEIGFFSGNPFVEVTKGVLHLYKEDILTVSEEAISLCLVAVPTSMTCHDLLAFTAPCHADIAHIRVLRDSNPNQYMALLNFRNHAAAKEFYSTFNGAPFSGLEPDIVCRTVWVSKIEWAHDDLPPPGHTELPTCPVCLERMDESVDGVLTILCNHAFHASCLDQWSDSTCPVCRCVQSPEQAESSECERCGRQGPAPDALWICLICGHVGCGRYQGGHAASHYRESGHCYALQLGSHRVWDYKGDNFVHRLLQNKADGKLVASEGPPPGEAEGTQEKVDSVQLEFTYLLTSQLEEQRMYFEEKLAQLDNQALAETKLLREKLTELSEENKKLQTKLAASNKERNACEKKITQQTTRLTSVMAELNEERQLGKALRANQQQWQFKLKQLEGKYSQLEMDNKKEVNELKEQVRDLMFYIDAQQKVSISEHKEEIVGGTVIVPGPSIPSQNHQKSRNKKKR